MSTRTHRLLALIITVILALGVGAPPPVYAAAPWPAGLSALRDQLWQQGTDETGDTAGADRLGERAEGDEDDCYRPSDPADGSQLPGDCFGSAVATGDFNGDHYADLAIGAPDEDELLSSGFSLNRFNRGRGMVNVIYGGPSGLAAADNQVLGQLRNPCDNLAELAFEQDRMGQALAVGDFNADSYADLAVGIPHDCKDVGSASAGQGSVAIYYGSAAGLNLNNVRIWDQAPAAVPGAAEQGDMFGAALAAGRFNSDSFADLAIGIPGEDEGAGTVVVLYGSDLGLAASGAQMWWQGIDGVDGAHEPGDEFGFALAAGDFDGDSDDDLAIGVPGENGDSGGVATLINRNGLTSYGGTRWDKNAPAIFDTTRPPTRGDRFGHALAAGRFSLGDNSFDLAIGIPSEAPIAGVSGAGAVRILYGSPVGIGAANTQMIFESFRLGKARSFAYALAAGDFNSDMADDLAIGGASEYADPGFVAVYYSDPNSGFLTGHDHQIWTQNSEGIEGTSENEDRFGFALAAGDFNGDLAADLAIGVPGEDKSAGAVSVLYGDELIDRPGIEQVNASIVVPNQILVDLSARVNPHHADTTVGFQLGTTSGSYTVTFEDSNNLIRPTPDPRWHSRMLQSGQLLPNTTYYYRILAKNSAGTTYSPEQSFTTPLLPTVTTNAATEVTSVGAVLNGTLTANGPWAWPGFEWGTSSGNYPNRFNATASSVSGTRPTPFQGALFGLRARTTYYFRAVGSIAQGKVYGQEQQFTTPNTVPTAAGEQFQIDEDQPLTLVAPGLLANDSDPDGDPLRAVLGNRPTHGTVALSPDGALLYTPAPNFNGSDNFTYDVRDGHAITNQATVSIAVAPINDAPHAQGDNYMIGAGQVLTIGAPGLLANDTDADGDHLRVSVVAYPGHGEVSANEDGSFSYTPRAGFSGDDEFRYLVYDKDSISGVASVTIKVNRANLTPIAQNDAYSTREATTLRIDAPGVLANDTDADGDTLSTAISALPRHGSLTLSADGSFVYTPEAGFSGADSFRYYAVDTLMDGVSRPAVVSLEVLPANTPPAAQADSYSATEDTPLTIAAPGVLANDSDPEGAPLVALLVSEPAHGSVVLGSTGDFVYTPEPNYHGSDSFTYEAFDGRLTSGPATVSIEVVPVKDQPTTREHHYKLPENQLLADPAPGLLQYADDADGDPLTIALVHDAAHGELQLSPDGTLLYQPEPGFVGSDSFAYSVSDGSSSSDPREVRIHVVPVNDAPVAWPDEYLAVPGGPVLSLSPAEGVLANDSDPDGDQLSALLVEQPRLGLLVLNSDGSLSYIPKSDGSTVDSFTYVATDGKLQSALVTVNLLITTPPTPTDDSYTTTNDGAVLQVKAPGLLANDSDADGDPLMAVLIDGPNHGTLVFDPSSNGEFDYLPEAGFSGVDSFIYRASDGYTTSAVARVEILVHTPELSGICAALATIRVDTNGVIVGGSLNGKRYAGKLYGTGGADIILGTSGRDEIYGHGGDDIICGGPGDDQLNGGKGNDRIAGEEGNDQLLGGDSNDELFGGDGNDQVAGRSGDDRLHGGPGADKFRGGPGKDSASDFNPAEGDRKDRAVENVS